MVLGEVGRTLRLTIASAVNAVVIVEIAAVVSATIGTVIVIRVAPGWSRVDWLHRDLGPWLSCGVEGLSQGVVLCPELHRGLHGDFSLLGKTVAAIGGRRAAIAWRWCAI